MPSSLDSILDFLNFSWLSSSLVRNQINKFTVPILGYNSFSLLLELRFHPNRNAYSAPIYVSCLEHVTDIDINTRVAGRVGDRKS